MVTIGIFDPVRGRISIGFSFIYQYLMPPASFPVHRDGVPAHRDGVPVFDFASELKIFQDTFSLGMEIVSRIKHDQQACELLSVKAVPDFDPDYVRWEMFGPVFENHFGIIFRFPVNLVAELGYDDEKWR